MKSERSYLQSPLKRYGSQAFTMLEVMLVVIIMAAAVGFLLLYSQASQVRADVNAQASTLVSYMRLAQSDAMSGNGNQSHGIHLETMAYTIFEGSTYSALDTTNFKIDLPPAVTIENIALNGGGADVIFNPPFGETSTYGTFDITSSQIQKTISITVSQIGTIAY
ncbi:MAG: type II secretion system protein [Candidatus Peregrinibacteria bacterium]|nr:type II secretion system protein [Candidatus Peregrinibacteria bacterium]